MTSTTNIRNSRGKGKYSESVAVEFLKKKGFQIIRTNYLTPVGEADIIAKIGKKTIFVEVKSASTHDPIEAVNPYKINKLKRTALYYMKELGHEIEIRFDVITIIFSDGHKVIRHVEDAF